MALLQSQALHYESFMTQFCPRCSSTQITKKGFFRQKLSRKYIQRFWCSHCHLKFSASTLTTSYQQKKTSINHALFTFLCSGMSLRRAAKILNVSYSTVYARFLWLAALSEAAFAEFLKSTASPKELYLDEMESLEHTKLKPLTIPLLVDEDFRFFGISSGEMPAKGHLSEISKKKYGPRHSTSEALIEQLLRKLPKQIKPSVVKSDGKPSYRKLIQRRWKNIRHEVCPRKEEKTREQLYLNYEKKKYDPMFQLNQRCAKLRADVNRLMRRSWSTTKKAENLTKHLMIYACYNNKVSVI